MRGRWRWRWLPFIYLALLIASHVTTALRADDQPAPRPPGVPVVQIPAMSDDGPVMDRTMTVAYRFWPAAGQTRDEAKLPVILLHGSPGSSGAFVRLAPLLAEDGRDVYAIDLPGFGQSDSDPPSYSIRAHARDVLAFMDEMNIDRAHVLGWSLGGGVALNMVDLAPERVQSLIMLAAIGAQEAEGSGDYHFEHGKYAFGYATLILAPKLIPHFGLFGEGVMRHSFIRNFWDSDQRPLRGVMERLQTPTLILHGRHDPLVPAWGAELHHKLIKPSRLVMLDASHFLPFLHERETAEHVLQFVTRHDDPKAPVLRTIADMAPVALGDADSLGPFHIVRGTRWWVLVLLIIVATFLSEDVTVIGVGLLIARGHIDVAVGFLGCLLGIAAGDGALWALGRFIGRPALRWPVVQNWLPEKGLDRWGRAFDKHAVKAVFLARAIPGTRLPTYLAAGVLSMRARRFLFWASLAALLWTPLLLILAALIGSPLIDYFESHFGGPLPLIVSLAVIFLLVRTIELLTTRIGRIRLRRRFERLVSVEFWPAWLFYIPLAPWMALLAIKHRGAMSFTCVNPGVPHGGGVVGESKHQIMEGLVRGGASEWIVPTHLIDETGDAESRAQQSHDIVTGDASFDGYPVILKPDASQRGHAVRLARSRDDLLDYYQSMTRAALLQVYHPGPEEVGVLWSRIPGAGADEPGRIFSITRKVFPVIVGDGKRTLEELIWRHPRFHMQAERFLKRFTDQTDRVLFHGESFRLAIAGNHCQGSMFLDGADLITPALEARIDAIARSFPDDGFDFGRFDIRYTTDEALRQGEDFLIVELNGTLSESTNLYDPNQSIWWSYGVLMRQWSRLYELGAGRRRQGVAPMRLGELLVAARDHYRGRPGSTISD